MPRGILKKETHLFVDADPVVYSTRSAHEQNGSPKYKAIAAGTGLCFSTVRNLLAGKTRRPQHATTSLVMDFLGYDEVWIPRNKSFRRIITKRQRRRK